MISASSGHENRDTGTRYAKQQILGVRTRLSSQFLDPSPTREEGTNRGGFNLNQRFRPAAQ